MNRTPHPAPPPTVRISSAAARPGHDQPPAVRGAGRPSATSRRCWSWPRPPRRPRPNQARAGPRSCGRSWPPSPPSMSPPDGCWNRTWTPSAILAQAGRPGGSGNGRDCPDLRRCHFDGAWGVFAAEAARPAARGQGSRRTAVSAAGIQALVLARRPAGPCRADRPPGGGGRAAFAVDLHAHGVSFADPEWTSRGLREIPSGTVHFEAVSAVPLGGAGWYYQRPGLRLGRHGRGRLLAGRRRRGGAAASPTPCGTAADGGREPDQIALAHLGEIDRTLAALTAYLAGTAARIDAGELSDRGAWRKPCASAATSPPPSNASRRW